MKLRLAAFVVGCVCVVPILSAQDAVKVDPKHYTVVTENDRVRVLKIHYGPHEKSVMHSHPDSVAVFLSDAKGQFTFPAAKRKVSRPKQARLSTPRPACTCRKIPVMLRSTSSWSN